VPLVIRLVRYVHVPRKFRRQVTNTFLFARDGYRCLYCGRHRSQLRGREFLTRDHVVPDVARRIERVGERRHGVLAVQQPEGQPPAGGGGHVPAHEPHEPNYVELVWAVRRITPVQAKYIRMFYGADVLRALQSREPLAAGDA
jgi:molecular chaperone DnaK (HSP70)